MNNSIVWMLKRILETDDIPDGQFIKRKHLTEHTGSVSSLSFAKNCFQECLESHLACRHSLCGDLILDADVVLPSRLIKIPIMGSHENPKLIVTEGLTGRYAALSYRWGPSKDNLKTEAHNLKDRLNGIPFDTLPRTFADAIVILQTLGINYLWIDSLCIIQGDHLDWENVSRRMDSIYRNACLTIAAADAPNANAGIFYNRAFSESIDLPYNGGSDDTEGREGKIWPTFTVTNQLEGHRRTALADCELGNRAWATQEWGLSRRVIYCREQGLEWVCAEWFNGATESGRLTYPDYLFRDWKKSWRSVVFWYSRRELTFKRDRYLALSGLAKEVARIDPEDQYVYGMWMKSLFQELLWMNSSTDCTIPDLSSTVPTWSWILQDAEIYFLASFKPWKSLCSYNVEQTKLSVFARSILLPEVKLLYVKNEDGRFDRLEDGEPEQRDGIVSECEVQLFATLYNSVALKVGYLRPTYGFGDDEQHPLGWVTLDNESLPSNPVSCLRVASVENAPRDGDQAALLMTYGVLLVQTDPVDPHKMTRVGIGEIIDTEWFDTMSENEREFLIY